MAADASSVGVGLISYGYMGKVHSLCYRELPFYYDLGRAVRLVAVATPSQGSRKRAMREAGFKHALSDPYDLIGRSDVDVIDICAPTYLHEEYACAAVKAGKAVYIEKPLARTLDSARRIYQAVTDAGVSSGIAFEYRFVPALMRAKRLLDEGSIGSVIHFRAIYQGAEHIYPAKFKWQLDRERAGGGALFALGSHLIDLVRYLLGEYSSIHATQVKCPDRGDVEQVVFMQAAMDGGAQGSLEVSQVAAGSNIDIRLELYGTKGSIQFDNRCPNILRVYEVPLDPLDASAGFTEMNTMQQYKDAVFPPPRVDINWLRYHLASQYQFVNGLLDKNTAGNLHPTVYDGLRCQEVMEAAMKSIKEGGTVFIQDIR